MKMVTCRSGVSTVLVVAFVGVVGMMLAPRSAQAQRSVRMKVVRLQAELADLRAELATIKGQMAQLDTAVEYQGRRAGMPQPNGGTGLCGDPCATDSDEDGVNDCEDLCPCDPNNADSDGDQMPDCYDPCPDDAANDCINPCRQDTDGDHLNDCEDPCPYDPAEAKDTDADGIADCQDPCPDDASNRCIYPCPLDQDGDGMKDCNDVCPWAADGSVSPNCPVPMTMHRAAR